MQRSYELFLKEKEELAKQEKPRKTAPQEIWESKWRMLPQRIEEWQREGVYSLFSLRLKAIIDELLRKPEKAKEAEAQLSSQFQSLLSQWEAPPISIPPAPSTQEEIPPPKPPSLPRFWWNSPILIGSTPPSGESASEMEFQKSISKLNLDIEKQKRDTIKELLKYEKTLQEVKRRCPLP